jgi:phosphate transport system permease protein
MLVGALPAVPELPLDTEFPYLHASRSFMHLGYQVYALGIQSRDTEAARPVVFAAILLLVISVASLNLLANHLRSRMRRRIQRQVL